MTEALRDPTGARLGPWQVEARLGAGGMGTVYRAHHYETKRPAALKLVQPKGPGHLASLRREIGALARLRHPGVVRVLDHGLWDGMPWCALALVEGQPLEGLFPTIAEAGGATLTATRPLEARTLAKGEASPEAASGTRRPPPDLARSLTVIARLCHTLAYLHGEGLVHGDLKPQNVLVGADDLPVLVDFGVTARFVGEHGRELIDAARLDAGTPAYMAPEMITGDEVDARADLYAVGCMLYELLTGGPPFRGVSAAVLAQQVNDAPVRPSALLDAVPPRLEALILGLLAKAPEARVGHALAVADVLEALGARPPPAWPAPQPHLYRSRLAGRDAELATLLQELARAHHGRGSAVRVTGEPGTGKSRLVSALIGHARDRGFEVLAAACGAAEHRGDPVPGPIRRILLALTDRVRTGDERLRACLDGERGLTLAPWEPALAATLRAAPPGGPATVEALPPALARRRLFVALCDVLAALGERRPLLLAVDDAHWADALTLGFLEVLRERLPGLPLLLVLTASADDVPESLGGRWAREVRLGPLGEAAVERIVCQMLATSELPTSLRGYLARHGAGNPLSVATHLRGALEAGLLVRTPTGGWRLDPAARSATRALESLSLPDRLSHVVRERVARLSAEARTLAQAAALVGREVPAALLHALSPDADALLGELRARDLVVPHEDRLAFVHEALRREVVASAAPERRARHRAVALAIEAMSAPDPVLRAQLGAHWESAGEPARAHAPYLEAGRAEAARSAYQAAEALLEGAIRTAPTPADEATARLALADAVLLPANRYDAALEQARAVRAVAEAAPQHARALVIAARVHRSRGALDAAERAVKQALDRDRAAGDRAGEGVALGVLATVHTAASRPDAALTAYHAALELQRATGDAHQAALTLGHIGIVCKQLGRLDEARARTEEAVDALAALGARRVEGLMRSNLANILLDLGDDAGAAVEAERAWRRVRAAGDRHAEGVLLNNRAMIALRQGRHDAALRLAGRALELHRAAQNLRSAATTALTLGEIHAQQGQLERAAAWLAQAAVGLRAARSRRNEAQAWLEGAIVARRMGLPALAAGLLDEAESTTEGQGAGPLELRCLCERGMQAGAAAADWLATARARVDEADAAGHAALAELAARVERPEG